MIHKASPASERLHLVAIHNLAYAVSKSREHPDKTLALKHIRKARQLVKGPPFRNVGRYRLQWIEGITWAALGLHARADKAFRIALEGFQHLRLPWEIALVSLDLGAVLHIGGEWAELEKLAAETYQRFQVLSGDSGALAALSQWMTAVNAQRLTDEVNEKTRAAIQSGVFKGARKQRRKR